MTVQSVRYCIGRDVFTNTTTKQTYLTGACQFSWPLGIVSADDATLAYVESKRPSAAYGHSLFLCAFQCQYADPCASQERSCGLVHVNAQPLVF